ncbi:MAG TPA: response regulator [Spirochaetota bacterium]|nr:response regulator [Spirochaetota bacterium]HOL55937.1 response regulator [Spirochaetota bacterium]HPP03243.1 response regulator [Spirochaetota bacterium]
MSHQDIYKDIDLTNKSVLIVDDNPNNLKILGTMLESIGFNVRVAKSGEECLKSIAISKPDIILLDIHMPGMDGYEVCKIIKADSLLNDIPVIFISALTEEFQKSQAFEVGGVDYIVKPFELKDVELRVKTHLLLQEKNNKLIMALKDLKEREEKLVEAEKMASLGIMTAGIAHEINNPINFISNNFKALKNRLDKLNDIINKIQDKDLESQLKEIFIDIPKIYTGIFAGLEYVEKIIKSLRIYARMDKDNLVESDINELLESALTILQHKYKDIAIIEKKFNFSKKINCYPAKLTQVFINILANSIDAIKEAENILKNKNETGKITIITKEENNSLVLEFIDNGIGIEKENKNKIFDPFWTTKDTGYGTGLGLSIVSGVIRDLKGAICVESEINCGTKIKITIPLDNR